MKKLILALVALVATSTLSAQELRWGVTAGLNFANIRYAKANSSDCYVGLHGGVKAEMDLKDKIAEGFYADGRLVYTLKGGSWQDFHRNLGYVEMPFNFGYKFMLNQDVKLMAGFGPYVALGVGGKTVVKSNDTKTKTDVYGKIYKRFDFGLNYTLGVELYDKWQVFMGFEHGLVNAYKNELEGGKDKVHPLNFYIGGAYMF